MNESNEILISHLKEKGLLNSKNLEDAFRTIDRADFIIEDCKVETYEDYPLPIGFGQTISQPTTVAFMLELLDLKKGDTVLDVGSGSGWTTALIAEIIKPKGKVWGVEIVSELAEFGGENLAKYNLPNAEIFQAGKKIGLPEYAPYDKILVSAEAEDFPQELLQQLKVGGIIVIPIKNTLYKIEKLAGGKISDVMGHESLEFSSLAPDENKFSPVGSLENIKETAFPGFVFVPLVNYN